MKNIREIILYTILLLGGFSLGVFFQVFREFILPFSMGKIGDAASLVSAIAAILTLFLGLYVARQWKDQLKYAEEVEALVTLRGELRAFCMSWFNYVDKKFSEKNLIRHTPLDYEDERDAFIAARHAYTWCWNQVDGFELIDKHDFKSINPVNLICEFNSRCAKSFGLSPDEAREVNSEYMDYLGSVLCDGVKEINRALKELRK
ncbi:hypothetical protein C8E02_0277 [Vogesella indigofera]|uniref:Uncharacterized protein n=1 Tax=Vogesella indigofera TaxID=45465 RepID=A0A495BNT2_VOGIN|nr:hypothetical protein [Vogesella indigofera]RKQ62051.1 hypothetical protein C8E02_0277 [Vogesella indigofera]